MDFHIHFPEGAVPKDGPSAGITIVSSLVSALLQAPLRKDVAMTGEINLRGKVLPIGGLKEKVLAAYRADIKTVICPKENEKDLHEVPKNVMRALQFKYVDTIDEVLRIAIADLPEDHPNQNLRQFLAGGEIAPDDWRAVREWVRERDRKARAQAAQTGEHGPH